MMGILKYQNPSGTLPDLIERVNTSKADFVQRLKDPNRKYIQDWLHPLDVATHKLGWAHDNSRKNKHGAFVFPMVQNINGELVDFTYPRYLKDDGVESAIERRDTVQMTPEQAEWFTKNYKSFYPSFDYGSR